MAITPDVWLTAAAALEDVSPRNSDERDAKTRLMSELDRAVGVFCAGPFVHRSKQWVTFGAATTVRDSWKLLARSRELLTVHLGNAYAHWRRPTVIGFPAGVDVYYMDVDTAYYPPESHAAAYPLANAIKAAFNTHVTAADLHFGDASAALISLPDATDDDSLITLANDIAGVAEYHMSNAGPVHLTKFSLSAGQQLPRLARAAATAFPNTFGFASEGLKVAIGNGWALAPSPSSVDPIAEAALQATINRINAFLAGFG